MRKYLHIALNVIAIIICGALGGGVGFAIARAISLDGVLAALVAAVIGMVIATAAWAGGSSLLLGQPIKRRTCCALRGAW